MVYLNSERQITTRRRHTCFFKSDHARFLRLPYAPNTPDTSCKVDATQQLRTELSSYPESRKSGNGVTTQSWYGFCVFCTMSEQNSLKLVILRFSLSFIVRKTMDKLLCALLAATIVTISGCAQFPINTQPTNCGSFPSSASDTAGPKNC